MTGRGDPPPGDEGNGRAGEAASAVQEKAQQVAGEAQQKAEHAAGKARDKARTELDRRSTQVGERVHGAAEETRHIAEHLRKEGKDQPARYAEQAAERVDRLAGYLRESDSDRMLRDIEDFGRRNPWAMVAGGLALGFAAARFLKTSSAHRQAQSGGQHHETHPAGYPASREGVLTGGQLPPATVAPQAVPVGAGGETAAPGAPYGTDADRLATGTRGAGLGEPGAASAPGEPRTGRSGTA